MEANPKPTPVKIANQQRVINPNAEKTDNHPYHYFHRAGDPYRPAPARIKNNPAWYPMRKFLLDGLRPVGKYAQPTMTGDYPERINDLYWQGDELMDNVVIAIRSMKTGEGRKMFTQALKHGIDTVDNPPEAFIALFKQLDRIPDWVDWEQINAGGAYYSNLPIWAIAFAAFMPILYTTHGYATSIPVGATGRFIRQKENRMIEGLHFLTSITEPDGLGRYSYGFECAVHVRLMHAFVRHQMYSKNGEFFEYSTDGDPLSQPDTLVGIPVFGISMLLLLRAFGAPVTEKQMNSVDMLWRYVVYLMGGEESGIPCNLEESLYLLDHYIATQGKPSMFTDELNKAFLIGIKETVLERSPAYQRPLIHFLFEDVLGSFMMHMVGEDLVDEVRYLKKPNLLTKQLPKLLQGWVQYQNILDTYKPNEDWNNIFHRNGKIMDMYKSLMRVKEDETDVTFRAHDNTQASDLGKKTKFAF